MEILKSGNPNKIWKYCCDICSCIFAIRLDERVSAGITIKCPYCGNDVITDSGKEGRLEEIKNERKGT